MNIWTLLLLIQVTLTLARRRRIASSSESIENLIYYKDCKSKTTTPPPAMRLKGPPPAPELFCTMCCGSNCVSTSQAAMRQQQQTVMRTNPLSPNPASQPHSMFSIGASPFAKPQNNILADIQNRRKRLKPNFLNMAQSRRSFSKDHIKSLISQDDDIKKILKELVRVTMQKVDLLSVVNHQKTTSTASPDEDNDDDGAENEED